MTQLENLSQETRAQIELLLRCGVTQAKIVKETGATQTTVAEVASFRSSSTFSTHLNPADAELADAMRTLAWKAYEEAYVTMEFGSPSERASLVRAVIARSMSLVGAEKSGKMDSLRDEFNEMIGAIRSPNDYDYDLPEDLDDAIETGATSINVNNS